MAPKTCPKTTIPETERADRGYTRLRTRLDPDWTARLQSVLTSTGETEGAWVRRKISDDFAGLRKRSKK